VRRRCGTDDRGNRLVDGIPAWCLVIAAGVRHRWGAYSLVGPHPPESQLPVAPAPYDGGVP
jgi:hypothetical protein